mgnify:CR=1 FL=1
MNKPSKPPIGAVYALAEVAAREWWETCGSKEFSGMDFAQHRQFIEVPRAETKLRQLFALPKVHRDALASALLSCR